MKRFIAAGLTLFALALGSGCVHFSYEGESMPAATQDIRLYFDAAKVPAQYTVLGKAVAYGSYQDVTRERLEARLLSEAESRGADAVLVTAVQVVPEGQAVTIDPALRTMETVSADNTYSLNQLQKDFDGGYGQAQFGLFYPRGDRPVTPVIREYRRIFRAEFLRYTAPLPKKPAAPATPPADAAPARPTTAKP